MTPEACKHVKSLLRNFLRSDGGKNVDLRTYLADRGITTRFFDANRKEIKKIYHRLEDASLGLGSSDSDSGSDSDSESDRLHPSSRETSPPSTISPSNSITSNRSISNIDVQGTQVGESTESGPKLEVGYGKIWVTDDQRSPVVCVFSGGSINCIGEHIIDKHLEVFQDRRKGNTISLQFQLNSQTRTRMIDFEIKPNYQHDILFSKHWDVDKKPSIAKRADPKTPETAKRKQTQGPGPILTRTRNEGVKSDGSDAGFKSRRERALGEVRPSTPKGMSRLPVPGSRDGHQIRCESPASQLSRPRTQSTPMSSESSVTMSTEALKLILDEIKGGQSSPAPAKMLRKSPQIPRRRRIPNGTRPMSSSSCRPRDTDSDDRCESDSSSTWDNEPAGASASDSNSAITVPDPPVWERQSDDLPSVMELPEEKFEWGC